MTRYGKYLKAQSAYYFAEYLSGYGPVRMWIRAHMNWFRQRRWFNPNNL